MVPGCSHSLQAVCVESHPLVRLPMQAGTPAVATPLVLLPTHVRASSTCFWVAAAMKMCMAGSIFSCTALQPAVVWMWPRYELPAWCMWGAHILGAWRMRCSALCASDLGLASAQAGRAPQPLLLKK